MTEAFTEITPSVVADNPDDALRKEVLRRMEVYVLELLHEALSPTSAFENRRDDSNCIRAATEQPTPSRAPPENGGPQNLVGSASANHKHRPAVPLRTLRTMWRHFLLLRLLYANVLQGAVQTHRDVYYHLVREIPAQLVVNRTVQQLACVLRVPRQLMGVTAGGRGFIAGAICYRGISLESPTLALEGMPLPLLEADLSVTCGDDVNSCNSDDSDYAENVEDKEERAEWNALHGKGAGASCDNVCNVSASLPMWRSRSPPTAASAALTVRVPRRQRSVTPAPCHNGFQINSNVRYILVVEKHAVFAQLLHDGLLRLLPCVVLTAQGFPTHAAHRLLANLHAALPRAAVVGLVDYNPHGLAIMSAYRWPSTSALTTTEAKTAVRKGAMPENRFCAIPALRWLGVRAAHVRRVEAFAHAGMDGGVDCRESTSGSSGQTSVKTARPRGPNDTCATSVRLHAAPAHRAACAQATGNADVVAGHVSLQPSPYAADQMMCAAGTTSARGDEATGLPSTVPAGSDTAGSLRLPWQPFSSRDIVVLDNLVVELEARARSTITESAAPSAPGTLNRKGRPQATHCGEGAPRSSGIVAAAAVSEEPMHPLSSQHMSESSDLASVRAWLLEAKAMRRGAVKCEMEVLYTQPFASLFNGAVRLSAPRPISRISSSAQSHAGSESALPHVAEPLPAATSTSGFAMWVSQQLLRGRYI